MVQAVQISAEAGLGQIHSTDPGLTDYAMEWSSLDQPWIASMASSRFETPTFTGSYPVWDLKTLLAQRSEPAPPGGVAPDLYSKLERKSFNAGAWHAQVPINAFQLAQAANTAVDFERDAVATIGNAIEVVRELQWKDAVLKDGVWSGTMEGTSAATPDGFDPWSSNSANHAFQQWSEDNADPYKLMDTLRLRFIARHGIPPNTFVMGAAVPPQLLNHPNVLDRRNRGQTTGTAEISLAEFGTRIRVPRVLVMESITAPSSFVNEKSAFYGYVSPMMGNNTPTSVMQASWTPLASGASLMMDVYPDRARRTEYIRGIAAYDFNIVSNELGLYIKDLVA